MDKKRFLHLVDNYRSLSSEETTELLVLQKRFPYSQPIRNITTWGVYHNNLANKKGQLYLATVYATDRALLKAIVTAPKITKKTVVSEPAKEDKEVVIEKLPVAPVTQQPAVPETSVPSPVSSVDDAEINKLLEELPHGLSDLKRSRGGFESVMREFDEMLQEKHEKGQGDAEKEEGEGYTEEYSTAKDEAEKKRVTVTESREQPAERISPQKKRVRKAVKKTTRKAVKKKAVKKKVVKKKAVRKKVVKRKVVKKKAVRKKVVKRKAVKKKAVKKKAAKKTVRKTTRRVVKKAVSKKVKRGTAPKKRLVRRKAVKKKRIAKRATVKSTKRKMTSVKRKSAVRKTTQKKKAVRGRNSFPANEIRQRATAKRTEKQKEQFEIIDRFIKVNPTIKKARTAKNQEVDSPEVDYTFSESKVSETLVQVLITQERYDKAIDILKKLIWKVPQKKAHFIRQIKQLEAKLL